MNYVINFLSNNCIKIVFIVLTIVIIICLIFQTNKDSFVNKLPPHINSLVHSQLIPQNPSAYSQIISTKQDIKRPPHYEKTSQEITNKNAKTIPNNIYIINTDRSECKQENFVNIYDSNFGGLLGTNIGTNMGTNSTELKDNLLKK